MSPVCGYQPFVSCIIAFSRRYFSISPSIHCKGWRKGKDIREERKGERRKDGEKQLQTCSSNFDSRSVLSQANLEKHVTTSHVQNMLIFISTLIQILKSHCSYNEKKCTQQDEPAQQPTTPHSHSLNITTSPPHRVPLPGGQAITTPTTKLSPQPQS